MAKRGPRKIHFQRFPTDIQALVLSKLERPDDLANALYALAHPGKVGRDVTQREAHTFVERFVSSDEPNPWRPVLRASLDATGTAAFTRLRKGMGGVVGEAGFAVTRGQLGPIRTAIERRGDELEVRDSAKNTRLDSELLLFNRIGSLRQGWEDWSRNAVDPQYMDVGEIFVETGRGRCVGVANAARKAPQEKALCRPLNLPQQLAVNACEGMVQIMSSLRIKLVIDITMSEAVYEGMFHFPHSREIAKEGERTVARFVVCMIFDHRRCNPCAAAHEKLEYELQSEGTLLYNVWGVHHADVDIRSWRGTDPKTGALFDTARSRELFAKGLEKLITNIRHPDLRQHKLEVWGCRTMVQIETKELGCPILQDRISSIQEVEEDFLTDDEGDSLYVKLDWGRLFRILIIQQTLGPSTLSFGFLREPCGLDTEWFHWMHGCSNIPTARFGARMQEMLGGARIGRKKRKRVA